VHAGESDGEDGVPERPHADRSRLPAALPSRHRQAPGRRPKGQHALAPGSVLSEPDEAARGPELEAAEHSELDLERPLDAANELTARLPLRHVEMVLGATLRRMRRRLAPLLLACVLVLAAAGTAPASIGPPPAVDAEAALVAAGSGEILYALDGGERLPMASITKLMTAIVALDELRPSRTVAVNPAAVGIEGSTILLRAGERISVRDLLAAALVQSANDAAYALAAATTGGNVAAFVARMNDEADELGLEDTEFANPAGLDAAGHYSSARDVLALAREAMRRPIVRKLVAKRGGTIAGGRSLYAWNDLLGTYPGAFGVKTGHTDDAGWCEVAAARRGGTVAYAVVLGAPSRTIRNADLAELLTYGLDHFGRLNLVEAETSYATASVPFEDETVPLVAGEAASAVVRLDRQLRRRVVAPLAVDAPVERGDTVGVVRVTQAGKLVAEVPLVAARDVEEPEFGRRLSWYADRALEEAGDLVGAIVPGL
jgi:serine-type D-Ala-D-Ala carboxypeptidase (penicillin-binding protein 5/6)